MSNWKQVQLAARKRNRLGYKLLRDEQPRALVKQVIVGGPWSPWPRDSHDGTCIWPSTLTKPPEWWDELWKITERLGGMVPKKGSFLEGYSPKLNYEVEP